MQELTALRCSVFGSSAFLYPLPDTAFLGGLQLMLYGCCWGLAMLLLAEQRLASVHWGVYCVLAGISVWLVALPQSLADASWMSGSLIVSLVGYAAAVRGVDVFLHERPRLDRLTWGVTGVCCAALLGLGCSDLPTPTHLVVFSVAKLLLLAVSALLFSGELWRQFGLIGALVTVVPSLLFGLASLPMLVRLATTDDVLQRVQAEPALSTDRAVLLMVAAALFNFSFLYLLVGRLVRRLRHHAQHDALTGLLNRRAMDAALDQLWQRHRQRRHGLAIAVLDIDHFKRINDTYGHETGDQALVAVAEALKAHARTSDLVARMGGEEFLFLMPRTDLNGAHLAVERLRQAVEALQVAVPGGSLRMTLSAGLAIAAPEDAGAVALVRRADAGVYRAKREGRNRVVVESAAAVP